MVVIASMIGARGLGEDVLVGIQTLNVGRGLEAGLAIVILAGGDAQGQVVDADHATGLGQYLVLGLALANHGQSVLGTVAENLEDVFNFNFADSSHLLASCRGRP